MISEYVLDAKAFNTRWADITWAKSTLRKWLNEDFYLDAFSEEERRYIAHSTIKNVDNPTYRTEGGNDTEDYIFLLSLAEAEKYFADDKARRVFPTDYAIAQKVYVWDRLGITWWWLRSPGNINSNAADVNAVGSLYYKGIYVYDARRGVRPALRIKIAP